MYFDSNRPLSVLLVDKNPEVREDFRDITDELSLPVKLTVADETGVVPPALATDRFDLLFITRGPYFPDCFSFYDSLKEDGFNLPPVVLITEKSSEKEAAGWFRRGGEGYISCDGLNPSALENSFRTALEGNSKYSRARNHALYDPQTGLWRARYLVEEFESLKRINSSEITIGASLIEVRGVSQVRKEGGVGARDSLLRELGDSLKSIIVHTGACGHYSGNSFWVFFKKSQTNLMPDKLKTVKKKFDRILEKTINNSSTRTLCAGIRSRTIPDNFSLIQRKLDLLLLKASNLVGSRIIMNSI